MEASTNTISLNRAKQWQIALFPFNNAATNVYFAFYTYFTYFALMHLTGADQATAIAGTVISGALALGVSAFTMAFVPAMRIFDGITERHARLFANTYDVYKSRNSLRPKLDVAPLDGLYSCIRNLRTWLYLSMRLYQGGTNLSY